MVKRLAIWAGVASMLVGCALRIAPGSNLAPLASNASGGVAVVDQNVFVTSPAHNAVVGNPLIVAGQLRAAASAINLRVLDANCIELASDVVRPSSLSQPWADFRAEIDYPLPDLPFGVIEISTATAGERQNLLRVPVQFETYRKPVVQVYFTREETGTEETGFDCGAVYPVQRAIEYTAQPIVSALGELFLGPTAEDAAQGYTSQINAAGVQVQRLEVIDGAAYVDFNQALQQGVAGSCRVLAIRAQLTETLKPFAPSGQVIISIDGDTEGILQP